MDGLKEYKFDLHVHTCLSPCGDYGMIPEAVVSAALRLGLDAVGICDHNSAANVPAFREAGKRAGLAVFGGMEITSEEEVHLLAFFDNDEDLSAVEKIIAENLPGVNNPEFFGDQVIMDSRSNIIGISEKLLMGAVKMGIDHILELIHSRNGIAVASHVDRDVNSVISQLGRFPENAVFDAVELSVFFKKDRIIDGLSRFPVISGSDAHYVSDIGRAYTVFRIKEPTVKELLPAFRGSGGRGITGYGGPLSSYSRCD